MNWISKVGLMVVMEGLVLVSRDELSTVSRKNIN